MSYVCDLFFNFSLAFVVINHINSFKLTYLFFHIFQNISYYFWMMMWMKKATNFEIVKVQAEDVAQLLVDLFVNFSLPLLIKVLLIKKSVYLHFSPSSQGRYTYDVHENCPIFKTPHPTCPAKSKLNPPPWPRASNFKRTTSPSPSDTQKIKRKHNPKMAIISYQVFPSGRLSFSVSINSLILSGFLLASFEIAEANLVPRAIFRN